MFTLYDYLTHVKGVEYIMALLFMAGYIIYAEILKPRPFKAITETTKEDMAFMGKKGYKGLFKTLGRIMAAPFIGLAYVVALPVAFLVAVGMAVVHSIVGVAHRSMSFGWRPMEAYLSGKTKRRKEKKTDRQ